MSSRSSPQGQARTRSTKLNFWIRISSGAVGVFHVKGWGQQFGMSLETQEKQTPWQDARDFGWNVPGGPEKSEKQKFVFDFQPT